MSIVPPRVNLENLTPCGRSFVRAGQGDVSFHPSCDNPATTPRPAAPTPSQSSPRAFASLRLNVMSSPSVIDISNDASSSLISTGSKSVLFFWADWHPSSRPGGSFDAVFHTLAKDATDAVKFYRVEAEEALGVSKKVSTVQV